MYYSALCALSWRASNKSTLNPWHDENDTAENNERARRAYTALMTVAAATPDTDRYRRFSKQVRTIARDEFNCSAPEDGGEEEPVNPFVAAFHEALLLYAVALNETIQQGGSTANGAAITRRMWGRTFTGLFRDCGERQYEPVIILSICRNFIICR